MKKDTDNSRSVLVLLDEEFGYRYWQWHTGPAAKQLIEWWSALESVEPYTMDPSNPPGGTAPLPGTLVRVPDGEDELAALESAADFSAHLNDDDDSFLERDGIYFYHRGYTGPNLNAPPPP